MSIPPAGSENSYLKRLVDSTLPELVAGLPAISLVGPRASGKTTTAEQYAESVVHLNREAEATSFIVDPDAALSRLAEPVLIDEWQEVPSTLGAVKRAVDFDSHPGRFLLTGSIRIDLEAQTWPATGRVVKVPVFGLTMRERLNRSKGKLFIERVLNDSVAQLLPNAEENTIFDYVEFALDGGFPDVVLNRSGRSRRLWLRSYCNELLSKDIKTAGRVADGSKIAAFATALAASSACVVNDSTLLDAAGISKKTADSYDQLLEAVFFSERIPAWYNSQLTRLVALPKRYLLDTSLLASLLSLDLQDVLGNVQLLGQILDTFVAAQIRPELELAERPATMHHLRTKGGTREIDILLEYGLDRLVGIEVKATATPSLADARHLIWARDCLGDKFIAGIVLHAGPATFRLSDRIIAAPISCIWS